MSPKDTNGRGRKLSNKERIIRDIGPDASRDVRIAAWKEYMGHAASGAHECEWEGFMRDFLSEDGMRGLNIDGLLMRRFLQKCSDDRIKGLVSRRVMEFYSGALLMIKTGDVKKDEERAIDVALVVCIAAGHCYTSGDVELKLDAKMRLDVEVASWQRRFWKDGTIPAVIVEEIGKAFPCVWDEPASVEVPAEPDMTNVVTLPQSKSA